MPASGPSDWRKRKSSAPASRPSAAGAGQEYKRRWQDARRPKLVTSVFWNRVRLISVAVLLLAALGSLVSLLLFIPRPVPLLAMGVTAYEHPYPPNAMVYEDLRRFDETFADYANVRSATWDDVERPLDVRSVLTQQLRSAEPGGPGRWWFRSRAVILYISAHGLVDAAGEPVLVIHDPSSGAPTQWRVRDLLQVVHDTVPGRRTRCLVILDCGLIDHQWPSAVIENRFAMRVDRVVEELALPRLAVLQSSGFGQPSTVAAELGGTAFGFFFAAGLRGAADLAGDANHRVSLRELERYLQTAVGRWSWQTRGRRQVPRVSPAGSDFELAAADAYQQPSVAPASPVDHAVDLDPSWARFVELDSTGVYSDAPVAWAELQQVMGRWEQLLWAGRAYGAQRQRVRQRALELLDQLEALVRPQAQLRIGSIAQIETWNRRQSGWTPASRFAPSVAPLSANAAGQSLQGLSDGWAEAIKAAVADDAARLTALQTTMAEESARLNNRSREAELLRMMVEIHAAQRNTALNAPLLELYNQSFQSEAIIDHRVALDWLADLSQRTALARNEVLDRYFTGSPAAVQRVVELTNTYRDITAAGMHLSAAHAQRDRIQVEVPYWLAWCLDQSRWRADERPLEALQKLITAAVTLDDQLANPVQVDGLDAVRRRLGHDVSGGNSGAAVDRGHRGSPACAQLYQEIWEMFLARQQELVNLVSEEVTQHRAEILKVVQLPLPGIDRPRLRQRVMTDPQVAQALVEQLAGPRLVRINEADQLPGSEPDLNDWLARHPDHPVLKWMRWAGETNTSATAAADSPTTSSAENPQALADEVVGRWEAEAADLVQRIARRWDELGRVVAVEGTPPLAELRERLSEAARSCRRVAYFVDPARAPIDVAGQAWIADRHARLLDLARRELRDFWGPDFFQVAAEHYLDLTSKAPASPLARVLNEASLGVRGEMTRLVEAARAWQPIAQVNPVIADGATTTAPEVQVRLAASADVQEGLATMLLNRSSSPETDSSVRINIATRTPGESTVLRGIPGEVGAGGDVRDLVVRYYFRGHPRSTPVVTESGLLVQAVAPPASARFVVEDTFQGRLVLVLDCSGTMNTNQRFRAARQSLYNLLDVLLKLPESDGRVAVFAYGHRTNWRNDTPPGFRTWRDALWDPDNTGVHPSADVEPVIPLAPLDAQHAQRIRTALDKVGSRGLTPLYLSIKEALTAMAPIGDSELHVIVLTDGANNQSLAKQNDAAEKLLAKITTDDQVIAVPGFRQARVDICVFDVPDAQSSAYDPLRHIAQESRRGQFVTAGNEQELTQRLIELALGRFRVLADGQPTANFITTGQRSLVEKVDLNAEYEIEYEGVFESARAGGIRLEGGEAVQVFYRPSARRLEFTGMTEAVQTSPESQDELSSAGTRWTVRVHDPIERSDGGVTFRVSLQNLDATRFTRRPTLVWGEVRPILGQRPRVYDTPPPPDVPTYYFMDRDFEPDRSVPVLRLDAARWPAAARLADLRLWVSLQEPGEQHWNTVKLPIASPAPLDLSETVRLSYALDPVDRTPWTMTVTETHQESSTLFPLFIQGPAGAERTTRTFLSESRQVRHAWRFPQLPAAVQGQTEVPLLIGSQANVTQWLTTQPMLVRLRR